MFTPEITSLLKEINGLVADVSLRKWDRAQMLAEKLMEFEQLQEESFSPHQIDLTLNLPPDELQMVTAIIESRQATKH